MDPIPPINTIVHVAPSPRDSSLVLVVIDPASADARGGSIRCTDATLRRLPAAIEAAIARFDAQTKPADA